MKKGPNPRVNIYQGRKVRPVAKPEVVKAAHYAPHRGKGRDRIKNKARESSTKPAGVKAAQGGKGRDRVKIKAQEPATKPAGVKAGHCGAQGGKGRDRAKHKAPEPGKADCKALLSMVVTGCVYSDR